MKLFELRTTLDWEWETSGDEVIAHFNVGDKQYAVAFEPYYSSEAAREDSWWELGFALVRDDEYYLGITKTGHAATVFAAVIAIVQEFIQNYDPDVLGFSAAEPERFRLYSRLLGILAKQGWRVEERELGGDMIYKAFRPGYEPN